LPALKNLFGKLLGTTVDDAARYADNVVSSTVDDVARYADDALEVTSTSLKAPASNFTRLEARLIQSPEKIAELAANMKINGWQGAPISVFENNGTKYILDGHHRVAAARIAGIEVQYNLIQASKLSSFGYKSLDDVIWAAAEAGGR
jgi:hypothetical protein